MRDIDKIHHNLVTLGETWAELDAAASQLEQARHSVRSQLAIRHLNEGMPANKSEMLAEADPVYVDHLKAMVDFRKQANLAQVNYKAAQVWVDLYRSENATKRAEMKIV